MQTKNFLTFLKTQPKGYIYINKKINETKNNKKELERLSLKYKDCKLCALAKQGRSKIVFGEGNPKTKLMFIGEAPGREEDRTGHPFVGRAGKLLTKMIEAINLTRQKVYISNVVKCRPPNNRTPLPDEIQTCKKKILFKEIEIIKPQIICCLGASATKAILGPQIKISEIRGQLFKHTFSKSTTSKIIPTFHPAYLLRNPNAKKEVWKDLKTIAVYLNLNLNTKKT